jgi:hypothetical protein
MRSALLAVCLLAAACGSRPIDVRVSLLKPLPPADGECVGMVGVLVENAGSESVALGRLSVLMPDERSDVTPPVGPPGPAIVSIEPPWEGEIPLEPGEQRVLTKTVVRLLAEPSAPFDATAHFLAFRGDDGPRAEVRVPASPFDPAAWPVAEPLTKDAIDRAVAEGRGVRVVFYESAAPRGGVRMLDVGPDGSIHAAAAGSFGTPDGKPLVGAAMLDDAQRAAFVALLRDQPFDAFRVTTAPEVMDGTHVRLLVAAGRSACVLSSRLGDFRAAGLEPLLVRLRLLMDVLPRK